MSDSGKVLIAHGNTKKLRAAVELLRDGGFNVIATPDGGDAFARFFEEEPGLVLCSAQLPGLSGVSFAAMVQSQAPGTHVLVLVDPDEPLAESTEGVITIVEPLTLAALRRAVPSLPDRPPAAPTDDTADNPTTSSVFALAALKRFQRDNSILAIVDDPGLARISQIARHEVRPDNEQVIAEGDPGDGFYLVVEGQVRVTLAEKNDQEIARIGAGGFFGEMAMLSDRRRSASVWTVGPTTLLFFDRSAFLPLLESYPTMREVLSGVALKRTEENLWRSLFDDEDVQRSLASLSRSDAPVPFVDSGRIAGEGEWSPEASVAAPLPHDGRAAGSATWRPYPSIDEAPGRDSGQVVDDGLAVAAATKAGMRKGLILGLVTGLLLRLGIGAVVFAEGESQSSDVRRTDVTPSAADAKTARVGGSDATVESTRLDDAVADKPGVEPTADANATKTGKDAPTADASQSAAKPEPAAENAGASSAAGTASAAKMDTQAAAKTDAATATKTDTAPSAKVDAASPPTAAKPDASPLSDADRKRLRRELIAAARANDNAKAVAAGLALEAGGALDWESAFTLARAQQLTGDTEHALARYIAFVAAYPKNEFADDAQFFSGEIFEGRGRKKDALNAYRAVIANPKSALIEQAQARIAALEAKP